MSLLHFVNLFPRGAIHFSHLPTSRFYFSHSFSSSSRSPSFSPLLFLSGYPVERARYPFRADIPWRIPGTKAATLPREYVGETRNVKRVRPLLPPLLLHLPIRPLCLSFSISFPPHVFVFRSLLSPILPLFASPLTLSLLFLSCLSRSLPIHRKVVVPGMRLIPREYQELSKRTEVG